MGCFIQQNLTCIGHKISQFGNVMLGTMMTVFVKLFHHILFSS